MKPTPTPPAPGGRSRWRHRWPPGQPSWAWPARSAPRSGNGRRGPAGYADPAEGLRIARTLEAAAARAAGDSIRYARQDGQTWQEIGAILELGPETGESGVAVAEAAFEFAAGTR